MNTRTARNKLEGAARWYIRRKVGGAKNVHALISEADGDTPEAIVDQLASRAARRAAARAFVTGLFGSPWTAIPLTLVDLDGATSAEAKLAAAMGVLRDESFFEREGWDRVVLQAMLEIDPTGDTASHVGAAVARRYLIRRLKKSGLRVASNSLPMLIGAAASAAVEYALVKRAASRMRRRFDPNRNRPVAVEPPEGKRIAAGAAKYAKEFAP